MAALPLVLSYPRSGMNWLRYCVERMSGRPTPGPDLGLVPPGDFVFCRLHDTWQGTRTATWRGARWDRVCLIVRDYRESYVRTPFLQRRRYTTFKKRTFAAYAENIRYFDQFPGDKLLLRYETHIKGFEASMRFMEWAGIDYTPLPESAFKDETEQSRRCYQRDQNWYYWRIRNRNITPGIERASRQAVVKILGPDLFEKYLASYDQPAEKLKRAG